MSKKLFTAKLFDAEYNDTFEFNFVAENFWDFACEIENKYLRRMPFTLVSVKTEPLTVFNGFASAVAEKAELYNGDFDAWCDNDEKTAEEIINWCDVSQYHCCRVALLKHYFNNFGY